jgi:HK97 family phage portal protein
MVGDLERSTYSNIEQQAQEFLTYCLMPYLVKIETELNNKLLRVGERGTYYFRFGLNGLLRADSKSRSEYYKNMYMIGCMNSNEIRELEEMNKYEGGDEFYVQQNMTTTDNAINKNNE